VPADIAFSTFQDVYRKAYELDCKGCTTYRPNEVTGSVLSVREQERSPDINLPTPLIEAPVRDQSEPPPAPAEAVPNARIESGEVIQLMEPLARPEALPGQTYKLCWPESDHAIYITINDVMQDGRRRPFEMFINSKNMDHYAWSVGLTRMISAVFRRGGDVSFVVEELKAVFDPRGGASMEGRYVPSLLAAIGDVIARHLVEIGFMAEEVEEERPLAQVGTAGVASTARSALATCPGCGAAALVRQEGCSQCTSCGQGKCG